MNTHLTAAQAALAGYEREVAALHSIRIDREKTIAESEAKLADLEVGKGAPDKVSDWLKLKSSIVKQVATALAELATNSENMTALGQRHAGLVEAVDSAVRSEMVSRSAEARATLREALAQATKAAANLLALDATLRQSANAPGVSGAEKIRLHRFANELPALPGAVRELEITGEMVEAERRQWSALAERLKTPVPEDATSTAVAAE